MSENIWIGVATIVSSLLTLLVTNIFNLRRAAADADKVTAEARVMDADSAAVLQATYSEIFRDQRSISENLQARLTAVEIEQAAAAARYGENTQVLLDKIDDLKAVVKRLEEQIMHLNQQLATEKLATAAALADNKEL